MTKLKLAAYHEAAHAMLALDSGCALAEVTVNGRGGGRTRASPPEAPRARAEFYLAGLAAEAVLLGLDRFDFGEVAGRYVGDEGDLTRARATIGIRLDDAAVCGMLEHPWRLAVAHVRRRWGAVERLARELRSEGSIDGARAAAIVRRWL